MSIRFLKRYSSRESNLYVSDEIYLWREFEIFTHSQTHKNSTLLREYGPVPFYEVLATVSYLAIPVGMTGS